MIDDALTEIQPTLLIWTNGQHTKTPRQFSSTTKGIYSCVVDARHLPKGASYSRALFSAQLILFYAATDAIAQTHPDAPNPLFTGEVEDLSKKFLDFYDTALQTNAKLDERWKLWKEKCDYAAVPPIPAGLQMAREQLDAPWPKRTHRVCTRRLATMVLFSGSRKIASSLAFDSYIFSPSDVRRIRSRLFPR